MSAREEVLRRVRSALAAAPGEDGEVPRGYRLAGQRPPGHPELLELLVERLVDYRATVRRATDDGLADAVAGALAEGLGRADGADGGGRTRVVVPPGLPPGWLAAADAEVVTDDGPDTGGPDTRGLDTGGLDGMDAVVTAAAVAIAETGTIVLDGSPDQGRRAISLVPDLHVCVVRADQVVASVPESLPRLDPGRPLTWISGPSATSDIELDRVEGVHGPRTLAVVLVESRDT